MLSYYLFTLSFLVYLHQYVYVLGESLLFKYYITDSSIADKFSLYKRRYIVKNLWKSCVLLLILLTTSLSFIDGFFNDLWSNLTFNIWGTLYVALDLSGLVYVRGLPTATKVHHIVVCVLGTLNSLADYNLPGYYRSILIYTYFSMVPFIVNFYLGYRYLERDQTRRNIVARLSNIVYTLSLGTNILCQLAFFWFEPFHWSILVYFAMYCMIINDDIKLIRFLRAEAA